MPWGISLECMNFSVLDAFSEAGNSPFNEDTYIVSRNFVAVIDGATGISNVKFQGYSSYAAWFVDEFKRRIISFYNDFDTNIPEAIRLCVNEIKEEHSLCNIPLCEKPTFTIGVIQVNEDIQSFLLGDCYVYILNREQKIIKLYDDRIKKFTNKTLLKKRYAITNNLSVELCVNRQKTENSKYRNQPNGFWVVDYNNSFYNEFISTRFPLKDIESILICSDGFNRAFDEFNIVKVDDILKQKSTIKETITKIREFEFEFSSNILFPCVKRNDDATAVLIGIDQPNIRTKKT